MEKLTNGAFSNPHLSTTDISPNDTPIGVSCGVPLGVIDLDSWSREPLPPGPHTTVSSQPWPTAHKEPLVA